MANLGNGIGLAENSGGWIPNPENIDLINFTEGEDLWYAQYAKVEDGGIFTADYSNIPGWIAVNTSIEEGADVVKVTGTFQGANFAATKEKKDALKLFFRKHSSLGDSSFYFIKRWEANVFDLFPDEGRDQLKYFKAAFLGVPKAVISERVLHFSFSVRSIWGS